MEALEDGNEAKSIVKWTKHCILSPKLIQEALPDFDTAEISFKESCFLDHPKWIIATIEDSNYTIKHKIVIPSPKTTSNPKHPQPRLTTFKTPKTCFLRDMSTRLASRSETSFFLTYSEQIHNQFRLFDQNFKQYFRLSKLKTPISTTGFDVEEDLNLDYEYFHHFEDINDEYMSLVLAPLDFRAPNSYVKEMVFNKANNKVLVVTNKFSEG